MSEAAILAAVRIALSKAGVRIFRNQTGALRDKQDRLVRFGLCVGSSDLIGWRSILITPDMVGTRMAQFVACETKDKTIPTREQRNFLDAVATAGGIAILAHSVEEAVAGLVDTRSNSLRSDRV